MSSEGSDEATHFNIRRGKMVKKVVDYKLLNGRRYYKVKWECTWELEDDLHGCPELVDQFWGFVNRVKSEDDRYFAVNKRDAIVYNPNQNSENIKCEDDQNQQKNVVFQPKKEVRQDIAKVKMVVEKPFSGKNVTKCEEVDVRKSTYVPSMVDLHEVHHSPLSSVKENIESLTPPQNPSILFKRRYEGDPDEKLSLEQDGMKLKFRRQDMNGRWSSGDERRFKCPVCGMGFKRKDMCTRHMRTHSKDFCYFCSVCNKGFIRRYVLLKHLNREHNTIDENKIISTKRKRKDIVQKEAQNNFPMEAKCEMDIGETSHVSEYDLDPGGNLLADNIEHDYDKKHEEDVAVFDADANIQQDLTIPTNIEGNSNSASLPAYSKDNLDRGEILVSPEHHIIESGSRREYIKTAIIAPLNDKVEGDTVHHAMKHPRDSNICRDVNVCNDAIRTLSDSRYPVHYAFTDKQ